MIYLMLEALAVIYILFRAIVVIKNHVEAPMRISKRHSREHILLSVSLIAMMLSILITIIVFFKQSATLIFENFFVFANILLFLIVFDTVLTHLEDERIGILR